MTPLQTLGILSVVILWGFHFVVMKINMEVFTPFWFLFLRFFFSSVPFIFFIKRPNCHWSVTLRYALLMWVAQLGLLSYGIYQGAPTGLSALLMQSHAPLTLLFSVFFFKYHPKIQEVAGLVLSLSGITVVASTYESADSLMPLLYVIGAAIGVAQSNLLFKRQTQPINMFSLVVWSSLVAAPIFFTAALIVDGLEPMKNALAVCDFDTLLAMGYTVVLVSLLASTIYAHLIKVCEPARVAPYTLLTPVVGIIAGQLVFDEVLSRAQQCAALLIVSGLALNQWRSFKRKPRSTL